MFIISKETKVQLWLDCGKGNHELIFKGLKLHLCVFVYMHVCNSEKKRGRERERDTDKGDPICLYISVSLYS